MTPLRSISSICSALGNRQMSSSISARVLEQIQRCARMSPIDKGHKFLVDSCNAKRCFQPLVSKSSDFKGAKPSPFPEIFDTCLVLDLLGEKSLEQTTVETGLNYIAKHQREDGLFGFFEDPSLLPADVDDTSLATLLLLRHKKMDSTEALSNGRAVKKNVAKNGVIQTYFPPTGNREDRVDPSVCANALRLLTEVEQETMCTPTLNFLTSYLESRSKSDLYYSNDAFFYFLWQAMKNSGPLKRQLNGLFSDRIFDRIGSTYNPIDLSSRIAVLSEMGIDNEEEVIQLLKLQDRNGSWPIDIAYTGSRKNLFWGSKMVSTAFALRGLENYAAFQAAKQVASLPLFANGFQLSGSKLKYTHSFSPIFPNRKVIAITHTITAASKEKRFYDAEPHSPRNVLLEQGQKDAWEIGAKLVKLYHKHSTAIYHGENLRTAETAAIIGQFFKGDSLKQAAWLNEIDCIDWYGNSTQEILDSTPAARAMFYHSDCLEKSPNGESFLDVLNRVNNGLMELIAENSNKVIILCTSRVNLVALKVLQQKDVIYHSDGSIHWSAMSRQIGAGTVLFLNERRK